ncbi:sepiapterin reductase-like [Pecten maximus]|uniref:sepiapterin reductase-like n=1 Tax=Pecten maximus TaxID=6579 RepID=UPI0014585460|nr:sepiapterin reductase-like [Pecten maximus]XP_033744949.1 sepiapterin reductase-like [Pecten maximus]
MENQKNIFLKKTFVAITGASRGLGRCIALQFAAKFPPNSVFVLMARNEQKLESVKSEILSQTPNVTVLVRQYDQSSVEKDYFKGIFNEVLSGNYLSENDFDQVMIVHNCAKAVALSKYCLELCDSEEVRNAFNINLIGMILLNTSFFQTFSDSKKSRVVVIMSSACTSIPMRCMHLYSAAKAGRDMYMRVLAAEEPSLRILTFAPGASYTDMMTEVETDCTDKVIADMLKQFREDGKVTLPEVPISKLVQILEENTFENAVYVESESLF